MSDSTETALLMQVNKSVQEIHSSIGRVESKVDYTNGSVTELKSDVRDLDNRLKKVEQLPPTIHKPHNVNVERGNFKVSKETIGVAVAGIIGGIAVVVEAIRQLL
jgi:hypothetical protein